MALCDRRAESSSEETIKSASAELPVGAGEWRGVVVSLLAAAVVLLMEPPMISGV
jgi:hypothetical protein